MFWGQLGQKDILKVSRKDSLSSKETVTVFSEMPPPPDLPLEKSTPLHHQSVWSIKSELDDGITLVLIKHSFSTSFCSMNIKLLGVMEKIGL